MKAILPAPELWLTPLIGLLVLTYYVHHHGLKLHGSWIVAVLAGVLPLLAMGVVQSLCRGLPWPAWAKIVAGCVVGCVAGGLLVGYVYYYVLMPPHLLDGVIDEGRGDTIDLYNYQSSNFAIIGGGAALLSRLLAAVISGFLDRTSR